MIPSKAIEIKQIQESQPIPQISSGPKGIQPTVFRVESGQAHAAMAAALCALAIILVLSIAQWVPAFGESPISSSSEIELVWQMNLEKPFMLRF